MEPLHKELIPGISAQLDADGNLTIQEEQTALDQFDEEDGAEVTTVVMPAQAARALLKFLHHPTSRKRIGARLLQQ